VNEAYRVVESCVERRYEMTVERIEVHTSGLAIFKTALNVVRNAKVILDI
jgi:hypothetical protein